VVLARELDEAVVDGLDARVLDAAALEATALEATALEAAALEATALEAVVLCAAGFDEEGLAAADARARWRRGVG
jgi:hypothetical protein